MFSILFPVLIFSFLYVNFKKVSLCGDSDEEWIRGITLSEFTIGMYLLSISMLEALFECTGFFCYIVWALFRLLLLLDTDYTTVSYFFYCLFINGITFSIQGCFSISFVLILLLGFLSRQLAKNLMHYILIQLES